MDKKDPDVVFTGKLKKEKLRDLFFQHYKLKNDDTEFNPSKNHDVISLHKDKDGNWTGKMWKFGMLVVIRDIGPETVVQALLVHPGV